MQSTILIVGTILFGVGIILSEKDVPEDKKNYWKYLSLLGVAMVYFSSISIGENNAYVKFAQEVDLRQVPVVGRKDFSAQIQLIYKNGTLDTVTLIPKTTELSPTIYEVEPKK